MVIDENHHTEYIQLPLVFYYSNAYIAKWQEFIFWLDKYKILFP